MLESEVIKPFVLFLLDPEEALIPQWQLDKALQVMESWMVRRMLVRATTKSYSKFMADLITHLRESDRLVVGDVLEKFLAGQKSAAHYWPDDAEVRQDLQTLLAYRRLGRSRLRMVLESVEDQLRGWHDGNQGLGGERVARGMYAIEHVMPRKWVTHWPPATDAAERDRLIHTLGNLTLLTSKLNSKVSNAAWLGEGGKRSGLELHDILHVNRELLKAAGDTWTDDQVRARTTALSEVILRIWPVPAGHQSAFSSEKAPRPGKKVRLADLIAAGMFTGVTELYPRRKKYQDRVATLLSDGRIQVDDLIFESPSGAAVHITGRQTNGWSFFAIDPTLTRSLSAMWREYVDDLAVDMDDDDEDDDES